MHIVKPRAITKNFLRGTANKPVLEIKWNTETLFNAKSPLPGFSFYRPQPQAHVHGCTSFLF